MEIMLRCSFTFIYNFFYPKKYYTQFSTHPAPKVFMSLFSLHATPSPHKILLTFRNGSLASTGIAHRHESLTLTVKPVLNLNPNPAMSVCFTQAIIPILDESQYVSQSVSGHMLQKHYWQGFVGFSMVNRLSRVRASVRVSHVPVQGNFFGFFSFTRYICQAQIRMMLVQICTLLCCDVRILLRISNPNP